MRLECQEERLLSALAVLVSFVQFQLHAHFQQLEPSAEEFKKVLDLEIDDLLVVQVMVGLEVKPSIRDVHQTVNLHHG